jgi:hypothetical protein
MGLKYHSIPSRAESDNPTDGACVLVSPGRLRLGIGIDLGISSAATVKPRLERSAAKDARQ